MTLDRSDWFRLAKARTLVALPDGRVGRLTYFAPAGGQHMVLIGGRHERIPAGTVFTPLDPSANPHTGAKFQQSL